MQPDLPFKPSGEPDSSTEMAAKNAQERLNELILICFLQANQPNLVRTYMKEAKLILGELQVALQKQAG